MKIENNILIVDDDESTRKSIKLIFDSKGYNVDMAMSGKDAIKQIREKSFNAVLLDLKLPDIEGVELISIFKKITPGIAIFVITAYASLDSAMRAIEEGANGYITKPLNVDELLNKIQQALETQRKMALLETAHRELIEYKQKEKELLEEREKIKKLKKPYKLHSAIKYIKKHHANPNLRIKEIASAAGTTPKTLSRLWNSFMKLGMVEFLNNIRIEKAIKLLITTDLPIAKVAKKSGFSKEYFCIIFKSKTKKNPMKYRELHSKKIEVGARKEPQEPKKQ